MHIDLLLERYLNAFKMPSGDTYEIFINPSKRDIKDVEKMSYNEDGFRFIIDFDKKDVYIFSTEVIHRFVMNEFGSKYWSGLDYIKYLEGVGCDRYMLGHIQYGRTESDIWRGYISRMKGMGKAPAIEDLRKMQRRDKNWLKKYGIDPNEIQSLIIQVINEWEYQQRKRA